MPAKSGTKKAETNPISSILPVLKTVDQPTIISSPRARRYSSSRNIKDVTVSLIQKPLDEKEWCSYFLSLADKLKTEIYRMPRDIRVSKVFATLRGLCLGPEVVMSLSSFEQKFYSMEHRIKSQGQGNSNSGPDTINWTIECILNEQASVELSDVVEMDYKFGPGSGSFKSIGGDGEMHDRVPEYDRSHILKSDHKDYSNDDGGSPGSDSTVLGIRGTLNNESIGQSSRTGMSSKSGGIYYPEADYRNTLSTQYSSPSLPNPPPTASFFDEFSPILSPVRESKTVEKSWQNESLYLAPFLSTQADDVDVRQRFVSGISSPSKKRSPPCLPGSPGVLDWEKSSSFWGSAPQSPVRSERKNTLDKTTSLSYTSPDLLKKRLATRPLKGKGGSNPESIGERSPTSDSKQSRISLFRSPRAVSAGTTLGLSPTGRKYSAIKLDKSHRGFQSLESRTPTPTGRVVDDKVVKERYRSQEGRSTYFSTKTSITTASESSVITFTQYSQVEPSTPPKATIRDSYRSSGETPLPLNPWSHGDFDSSPERPNNRFSITSSLLSTPEKRYDTSPERKIYRDSFKRNSAASTTFSAATNSTGDIPNLAGGFLLGSVKRVPGAAKLIEVTKNASKGIKVPVSDGYEKQSKHFTGTSARNTGRSVNVEMEIGSLAVSGVEGRVDSTTKRAHSYGSAVKSIPRVTGFAQRSLSHGTDPRVREAIRRDAKKYLDSVQENLEGMRKDIELRKSKVKAAPEASAEASTGLRTPRKYIPGRSFMGVKNTKGPMNISKIERSHQRVPSNGSGAPNTCSRIYHAEVTEETKKGYVRPLNRGESSFRRTRSSGTLSAVSSKSSAHPSGQPPGDKWVEKALLGRKNNKGSDFSRSGGAVTIESGNGKTSVAAAVGTNTSEKLAKKSMPEAIVDTATNHKKLSNSAVLEDITGIGCSNNSRATPNTGRSWFGRRNNSTPAISRPMPISRPISISRPIPISGPTHDIQKENHRPFVGSDQQHSHKAVTPRARAKHLGSLSYWLSSSRRPKQSPLLPPPHGIFSQEEVESLIKRLTAQIPQTQDQQDGLGVPGGRYYSLSIPSLERSPSKDEKDRNPIAVCMDLINTASNEPHSTRRENLLQMSRVMVDAVSRSRDAGCAAEEAKMAAAKAEVAFLETKRHLAEMTELMKLKKKEIQSES